MDGGRKSPVALARVAALLTAAAFSAFACKTKPSNLTPPVPQVVVASVIQRDVPTYAEAVGTIQGFVNADISPRVSGYLLKQDYKDGSHVHANQLLFEIDARSYKAALDQALGDLAQLEAQLKRNQKDLVRYTALAKAKVISQQQFDTQQQTTLAAAGQVKAAQAAVEAAKLNLQWTKVFSPIDGVAAIAQAQVGNLVTPATLLTTVSQLDPIKVSFPISEGAYLKFASQINAREEGKPKDDVRFELFLGNGAIYKRPGQFYAVDRQVNVQTGTIQIQITFPNPEDILRPGMYAKIRVRTGVRRDALLVPQSAVFAVQGQYQVATVGEDNRVTIRAVKPGKKAGGLWLIEEGLKPKERVVAEGAQKVKDGMAVKPVAGAPGPQPDGASAAASPRADTARGR